MSSFLGTDTYAVDHKGRVAIPSPLRRGAARKPITTFVVNAGFDHCVHLYSLEQWGTLTERLRRMSQGNAEARAFKRAFLVHARQVTVDAQGRITITPALIAHAGLGKEAVLHGADDHIEIWSPERFAEALEPVTKVDGRYESLAEKLFKDES